VTGSIMSNARRYGFFGILLLAAVVYPLRNAEAQDRAGYVGQSVIFPVLMEPEMKRGDTAYAIDLSTALSERWFGRASFEFGLEGTNKISVGFGPEVFFRLHSLFKPFAGAQAVYELSPSSEFGVRGYVGVEINLVRLTKIDNLRLTGVTGVLYVFDRHIPNETLFEAIRLGLAWSY
jgi:hypothetical protein